MWLFCVNRFCYNHQFSRSISDRKFSIWFNPGTPPRKKKKRNTTNSNYCGICNIQYGSRMDNDYGLLWINCSAKSCKYWVHLFCIGLSCKDENEEVFAKITKYYCKRHNPHKIPWPKCVLKNAEVLHICDLTYRQTKTSTKIYQNLMRWISFFVYFFLQLSTWYLTVQGSQ